MEQPDDEGEKDGGVDEYETEVRVVQPGCPEKLEEGNDDGGTGEHLGEEKDEEDLFPPPEPEPRKCERREAPHNQREHRRTRRHDQAVQRVAGEREIEEHIAIGLQAHGGADPLRRVPVHFGQRFQGCGDRPEEREEHKERQHGNRKEKKDLFHPRSLRASTRRYR